MVALASAKEIIGIIEFQDQIKNKSEIAIAGLYKMGINPVMLTGDNTNSAKSVAASLDIINVMAGLLPGQKGEIIKQLRSSGLTAMAGDGINDALPLTLADVGISFNNGTDIAVNSADVIISGDNILGINKAVHLSRKTISVIKQNLFWALCYNVIGIPLAAGLFSSYGYRLTPMFAAACMSFSSILVIINALRLYLVNLSDEAVIKHGKNELKKIRTDRKSYFAEWTKTHKSIDIGMEKTDQTQVFPTFTGDDINSFSGNSSENITSTDCDPDVISNDNNSVKCNKCSADGDNNNSVSDSPDIRKSHDFRKYANTDSHKDKTDELNHDDIPVKTKENSLIFGKIFRFQKKTSDTDSAAKHADVSDGKGSSPENTGRNAATNTDSAEKTANLIIDGMMCEHCEQTVKKILEGTPHVNKVLVSRSRNAAVVLYNGSLDESAIKQKIHDAGFNLLRIMY
jgi:copper chaperone CopZ/soluble P-type ATPase